MKRIFTKSLFLMALMLALFAFMPAQAQTWTSKVLGTNLGVSAMCKDASGNVYVVQTVSTAQNATQQNAQIVKYAAGTTTPTILTGTTFQYSEYESVANYAFGLAIDGSGNIFVTTYNDYFPSDGRDVTTYGKILKMAPLGGNNYSQTTWVTGQYPSGNKIGDFGALAIDSHNNLFVDTYNDVDGKYEIVEYPSGSTTPTIIYTHLGDPELASGDHYTAFFALAFDSSDNLYAATSFDTDNNTDGGKIIQLTKASNYVTVNQVLAGGYCSALAVDGSDRLYASLANYVSGTGLTSSRIVKFSSDFTSNTSLYTGLSHDGSYEPWGLAVPSSSMIFAGIGGGTVDGTGHLGDLAVLFSTPATPASNVVFSSTAQTTTTISWTNGDGAARAVFVKATNTGTPAPVNSTTYTANTVFGSGSQIGATGWYCVYNGTGSTVNVTGLANTTTYRAMVVEYNGVAGAENYFSTTGTNNPNNVTTLSPSTTITAATAASGSPTNAASVNYNVTFAASVTGLTASNFTVTQGGGVTGASVTNVTGSGTAWTVTVGTGTGDGSVQLVMANATGLTPNVSNLPFNGDTYTIDKTLPTVVISRSDPNPIKENVLDYQAVFSEPVTGVTGASFVMTNSGVTTGAISATMIDSKTYNITVATVAGNGTARLDLVAGGATDAAGNQAAAFNGGANATYNVDQTAPTVLSINTADPNPTNASTINFTVKFSEPVTGVDLADFALYGTPSGHLNALTGSGDTYNVEVNSVSGEGQIGINLNNTGTNIFDAAGNQLADGGFTSQAYTMDHQPPIIISGSYLSSNGTTINYGRTGDNVTLSVGFDQHVTVTTFTIGGHAISGVNVFGNVWQGSWQVTNSDPDGHMSFEIVVKDDAGNVLDATSDNVVPGGVYVTIDNTKPVLNIGAPSPATVGNNGTFSASYALTYTEANLNYSSLSNSDITLNTTGTATGTVNVTGSGLNYTATISNITGHGTIGISVGPNTAGDLAGNLADAAGPSGTFNVFNSNAVLTKLAVNPPIHMSKVSGPDYADYTSRVGNSVSSVTLTPISVGDNTMTVAINGTPVALGTASDPIPLNVGTTVITTVVTAEDGVTQNTYKLTVTRIAESSLASLSTNPRVTLHTVTGPDYKDYTAEVMNSVNSIAIIPTTPDATNTIQVNGATVASGTSSASIPLTVGANTITTVVTDGTQTNTYSLVVTRKGPELSSLAISPNTTLKVVSGPDFKDYTASVVNSVSSVTITPTALDPTSTIKVNGVDVASGSASDPIALNVGANTINTVVTSQDGTISYTYSIAITRAPAAILSSLTFNPTIPLSTVSGPDYRDYTSRVGNSVSSVTVTPKTADPTNTIQVNGVTVASGTASDPIALNVGDNTIVTTITDGTVTNTYSTKITRLAPSILTSLTLNPKLALKTVTGPDYKDYTATADNSVSSVTLTATAADPTNSIQINGMQIPSGTESGDIPLTVGDNTITTTVTDGVTTNVYSMTITRLAPTGVVMAYQGAQELPVDPVPVAVHQNISPNGDGNSDHLQIDGITTYPDNKLQIMSRSGELVYEVKGYDNQNKVFDGHSTNGKLQLPGTYFYSLEYKSGKETKHKTGYFVLKY